MDLKSYQKIVHSDLTTREKLLLVISNSDSHIMKDVSLNRINFFERDLFMSFTLEFIDSKHVDLLVESIKYNAYMHCCTYVTSDYCDGISVRFVTDNMDTISVFFSIKKGLIK